MIYRQFTLASIKMQDYPHNKGHQNNGLCILLLLKLTNIGCCIFVCCKITNYHTSARQQNNA
jgi:hypothetical protein